MSKPIKIMTADALLSFLEGEKCAPVVRQLLIDALHGKVALAITTASLGEVYACIETADSQQQAERIISDLTGMGLEVVDISWDLTRQAAQFRSQTGAGEVDCLAAALALLKHGSIVTADPVFQKFSKQVEVEWLPRR